MIGRTVHRYEITAKLGQGGMGSVWKANDPLLERTVAVKFLADSLARSPDARRRFLREARAASNLHHPGIATVYDAGEEDGRVYIAFQHVDGETLAERVRRGALPLAMAARVAREAAEALDHAHARGVLHRDVTARNIMVDATGRAVIVDFGLALPEGHTRLTRTGARMGTAAYLAPEVIEGKSSDRRSDLYGLGIVLYEMLTGRLPFDGPRPQAILYAVVNEAPERPASIRPGMPADLEALVLRCIAKDPERRFQSGGQLATELRRLEEAGLPEVPAPPLFPPSDAVRPPGRARAPGESSLPTAPIHGAPTQTLTQEATSAELTEVLTPRRRSRGRWRAPGTVAGVLLLVGAMLLAVQRARDGWPFRPAGRGTFGSVAVLPLRNLSGDPEASRYLADGVGEALVTKLTRLQGLKVIPWVTALRYADLSRPLPEIARELNVETLVVGTFRTAENRIQGNVSLVEGATGLQFWSGEFERPAVDLVAVVGGIAQDLAENLRGELTGAPAAVLERPVAGDPQAYDLYLQGAAAFAEDPRSLRVAEILFERALQRDADLAVAHVGLGAVGKSRYYRGWGGQEDLARAESSFLAALALDPDLIAARRGMVRILWEHGRSEECLREGKAAAEINPDSPEALLVRAEAYFFCGLPDRAVAVIERALELDPQNAGGQWFLVVAHAWSGQWPLVIEAADRFVERFGDDPEIHSWLGAAHSALGDPERARMHFDHALAISQEPDREAWFAGSFLIRYGDAVRGRRLLEESRERQRGFLERHPDNLLLRVSLAHTAALLGDTDGLLREEDLVLREAPRNGHLLRGLAVANWMNGDVARGVELLRRAVESGFFPHRHGEDLLYPESVLCDPRYEEVWEETRRASSRLRALY